VLERGRELAEWLAARGVADVRDEMDQSERERARADAEQRAWVAACPNLSCSTGKRCSG